MWRSSFMVCICRPAKGGLISSYGLLTITGFPDSFLLWRHLLQSPQLQRDHVLIAVDIPGYGGSDSLPAYGPNELLEAFTEYIVGMRTLFLHDERRLVVVTHDWGTIIGARLASEAGGLADHWVITSAILVSTAMVDIA
jgi:pimeloyl-ACP methyl ester carboxylesterase